MTQSGHGGGGDRRPSFGTPATRPCGLQSKGLKKGSVSLVGAVAIGLAGTAPAYSLTGALGHGAAEAGYQLPVVFIIAVVPMFFVALAYKHLTDAAPDAGTVFTWGSKAIRPHVGWIGGLRCCWPACWPGSGRPGSPSTPSRTHSG